MAYGDGLQVCSSGHDEVCYYGKANCPACAEKNEKEEIQEELKEVKAELISAEARIRQLEDTKTWLVGEEA
jgi:hypothetical protein